MNPISYREMGFFLFSDHTFLIGTIDFDLNCKIRLIFLDYTYRKIIFDVKNMETKLTLHFDQEVIEKAKEYAASKHISLSRLTEFLYRQITSGNYKTIEDFPVSDWVNRVSEGEAVYKRRSRKDLKEEFFNKSR